MWFLPEIPQNQPPATTYGNQASFQGTPPWDWWKSCLIYCGNGHPLGLWDYGENKIASDLVFTGFNWRFFLEVFLKIAISLVQNGPKMAKNTQLVVLLALAPEPFQRSDFDIFDFFKQFSYSSNFFSPGVCNQVYDWARSLHSVLMIYGLRSRIMGCASQKRCVLTQARLNPSQSFLFLLLKWSLPHWHKFWHADYFGGFILQGSLN